MIFSPPACSMTINPNPRSPLSIVLYSNTLPRPSRMLDEFAVLIEDKEKTFTMMPSRTKAFTTSCTGSLSEGFGLSGLADRRRDRNTEPLCLLTSSEPAITSELCPDLSTGKVSQLAFRFCGRPQDAIFISPCVQITGPCYISLCLALVLSPPQLELLLRIFNVNIYNLLRQVHHINPTCS